MIAPKFRKQVELLLDVLPFIAQEEVFALKGGTAINLFDRNMPRLSVDIDLVYTKLNDRRIALQDITDIAEEEFERFVSMQIFSREELYGVKSVRL